MVFLRFLAERQRLTSAYQGEIRLSFNIGSQRVTKKALPPVGGGCHDC